MAKNENAAAAEAAAPKTTQELLALAQARVAKLTQRLTTENVLNGIEAGQTVGFRFGRNIPERTNKAGETVPARAARQLMGTVVGVKDITDDNGAVTGKLIKVQSGEGFEADTYTVNARDITSVGDDDTTQDDEDDALQELADVTEAVAGAEGVDAVAARDEVMEDAENGVDPLEAAE